MRKLTAYESGRRAFFGGRERAPMNDAMFVRAMYSDIKSKQILGLFFNGDANGKRQLKLDYIQQWKAGWDDAKDEQPIEQRND